MGDEEAAVIVICNSFHTQQQFDPCSPTCTKQTFVGEAVQQTITHTAPQMKLEG